MLKPQLDLLDSLDFTSRIQSCKPTSNRGAIQISLHYTSGCLSLWDKAARGARGVRANSLQAAVKTTEGEKEDKAATSHKNHFQAEPENHEGEHVCSS